MKTSVGVFVAGMAVLACVPLSACVAQDAGIRSVHTSLRAQDCAKKVDRKDPNETPYWLCAGVANYALIIRRAEAGRRSIDVVDPAQRVLPLRYEEFVTRHMSSLEEKAEWRAITRAGKPVPVALIVRVQAREDVDNPEKVTRTYLAIAKIMPGQACVTERIAEGTRSQAEVYRAADSAPSKPCASPLPPLG
jgi:hypothetical protein